MWTTSRARADDFRPRAAEKRNSSGERKTDDGLAAAGHAASLDLHFELREFALLLRDLPPQIAKMLRALDPGKPVRPRVAHEVLEKLKSVLAP